MEKVFLAAEKFGFQPTGRYFQLNSYENRVFEIFCENSQGSQEKIIVKAYRPGRWPKLAIQEEHNFLFDLTNNDFPSVTPFLTQSKNSIYFDGEFFFSIFPKIKGRMPDELSDNDLIQIGQRLALLHNIGQKKNAVHRPSLHVNWDVLDQLAHWVAPEVEGRYFSCTEQLFEMMEDAFDDQPYFRVHGDCHRGNILKTDPSSGDPQYFFVDFDDFINGPAVQDFWMLLSSQDSEDNSELDCLKKGYTKIRQFPDDGTRCIPLLRAHRIINYSNWIAQRWGDPTFPHIFPQFKDYSFWASETEALEKILWTANKTY